MNQTNTRAANASLLPKAWYEHDAATLCPAACVHEWFEEQVERSPNVAAIRSREGSWCYRELNQRSNQIANHLRALEIGPERLVGLCIRRSLNMIAGILGILKAGAAYVPLDPFYPRDRLAFMLDDSAVPVLLTAREHLEHIPAHSAKTILLDFDWPQIARYSDDNPISNTLPEHLAYVIYTSGSTGRPKGALITHRGLSNYLRWCTKAYDVTSGTGAPVHSSLSFDLTVTSLFAPLLVGRRVDLLDEGLGIEQLAAALRESPGYSLVKITPVHLMLLGRQFSPWEAAGRTKAFVVGGEQLTWEHVAFWREHAPETKIFNEYGPTETVVGCCVYQLPDGVRASGPIPIGEPIDETQLLILDENSRPCGYGTTGELYIGGEGVARGYLNDSALTAQRFLKDLVSNAPGATLYRTGDLCLRREDGAFEFVGRVDHQVKIRGYRVEPAEIESTLRSLPGVEEAVVVAHGDIPGGARLAAYVVLSRNRPPPTIAGLRRSLESSLPEAMIPSAIVVLEALPLSISGKVDRAALPNPDRFAYDVTRSHIAPENECERRLQGLWEEVLGIRPVGVEDDFLKLGGDSLRATMLVPRTEKELGRSFDPKLLLRGGTIRSLSRVLEGAVACCRELPGVVLRPGSGRPLFLLPGIHGVPEEMSELASHFPPGRPIYSIFSPELEGQSEPCGSIEELASYYVKVMRSVQSRGPYLVAGYSFGAWVVFEIALRLTAAGERVAFVGMLDMEAPASHLPPWLNPIYSLTTVYRFTRWAVGGLFTAQNRTRHAADIVNITSSSFLSTLSRLARWVRFESRSRGGGGTDPHGDRPGLVSRIVATKLRAEMLYRPRVYAGQAFLYRTPRCEPKFRPAAPSHLGWRRYVRKEVIVRMLEGDHLTFLKNPRAAVLASRIAADLARVELEGLECG